MKHVAFWVLLVIVAAAIGVFVVWNTVSLRGAGPNEFSSQDTGQGKSSPPILVGLNISEPPYLNRPVELTFMVTTLLEAKNASAQIVLPEGFIPINGTFVWRGDLKQGEVFSQRVWVESTKTGEWVISGTASSPATGSNTDYLYISISMNDAKVSDQPLSKQRDVEKEPTTSR